jgi:acetoin utilization deacetylase AcuC-like enzyme
LRGAKAAGVEMHAARAHGDAHILAVHTPRYVKFLANAWRKWNRPKGKAYEEMMASIRPVERPARYPSDILGQAGWHQMDFSCPITEQTWTSVKASADSALSAAELVVEGDKVAYALCRPPGHHAYADRAGGFCFLNNSAIVAQYLRQSWDQVAILDIDVHHGNGTQGIFYDRPDVLTVSIHADPKKYYPYYYGYETQRGKGKGTGYNINIPVPVKSDDEVWMGALEMALGEIRDAAPGALVIALGLDAHEADPLAGGAVTTGLHPHGSCHFQARPADGHRSGRWLPDRRPGEQPDGVSQRFWWVTIPVITGLDPVISRDARIKSGHDACFTCIAPKRDMCSEASPG